MPSVEALVVQLKELTPDQLERVARIIHKLSAKNSQQSMERQGRCGVSGSVLKQAIENGWPVELFTQIIGNIESDFQRPTQPAYEVRPPL